MAMIINLAGLNLGTMHRFKHLISYMKIMARADRLTDIPLYGEERNNGSQSKEKQIKEVKEKWIVSGKKTGERLKGLYAMQIFLRE